MPSYRPSITSNFKEQNLEGFRVLGLGRILRIAPCEPFRSKETSSWRPSDGPLGPEAQTSGGQSINPQVPLRPKFKAPAPEALGPVREAPCDSRKCLNLFYRTLNARLNNCNGREAQS